MKMNCSTSPATVHRLRHATAAISPSPPLEERAGASSEVLLTKEGERRFPFQSWNPWPVSITAFFVLALTGCIVFVVFCSRHPADLVAADYYEQELRYENRIEDQRRSLDRAQTASVCYDSGKREIQIALPTPAAAKAAGTIQLYRPSAMKLDRQLKLDPNDLGVQTIDAKTLLPGLWKVRVSWKLGGEEYFIDRPIVIASGGS
jgi:nitrogen fixation protein FixH